MGTDWMERARCKGMDSDIFFPENGYYSPELKAFCSRCPVRQQCFDYAVEHRLEYGFWGGASTIQRLRHRWGKAVAA